MLPALFGIGAASAQKPAAAPTFERNIRPILQARCIVCHNAQSVSSAAASGGLDLSSYPAFMKGVTTGGAARSILTGGKAAGGSLMERLTTTSPTRMMPKGGPPLPPEQIALFKRWIAAGTPRGAAEAVTTAEPTVMPMPAPSDSEDVSFKTRLRAAQNQLPSPAPKDPSVALILKVGPLPAVTALAYSPDGSTLAVGSYRAVTFWSTKTGAPTGCVAHLPGQVQAIAYRKDGAQVAIAGGQPGVSGEVRVLDTRSLAMAGSPLKADTEVVLSVAWNPDGTRLATGSQDKIARVWEWPSGKELKSFKDHGDAVTQVCFSPDGKSLYTASLDHNLRRFDIDKGTLTRSFTGHNEGVSAMALSLDGKRLISSGTEPNLRWWNTDTGDMTNNNGGHGGPVNELTMSKDGKLIVSVSADKTARVWDAGSTGQQRALEGSTDWVYAAAISPDSKFTAAAGADGVVRIWETTNGRLRLMLVDWPQEKSPMPEWISVTPEGYFDGSPGWCGLVKPQLTGTAAPTPQLAAWVKTLRQPDSLAKSWQGLQLDTANPK